MAFLSSVIRIWNFQNRNNRFTPCIKRIFPTFFALKCKNQVLCASRDSLFFRIKGLILCTDDMSATGAPIWFLLCLLISSIIFFHIPRLRLKYQCIIVLSLIAIHYILIRFFGDYVTFILGFPTFFISVFFMWIGCNYSVPH